MDEFIEKIMFLKEKIAELSKSEDVTEEQVEELNKAVISLKEHKAKKQEKAQADVNEKMKAMGTDIQRQIDQALREGVPAEGNFEAKPEESKKKKNHLKLVKALDDAGHRESALLLKNWGEMDAKAEEMAESLDKGQKFQLKEGGSQTQWGTSSKVKEAKEMKERSKKQPVKTFKPGDEGFDERVKEVEKK